MDIENLECLSKCLQATKFRKRFGALIHMTECSCAPSRWRYGEAAYSESHISQVRNSCTDGGSGVSFRPNFVQPLNFSLPFLSLPYPTPTLPFYHSCLPIYPSIPSSRFLTPLFPLTPSPSLSPPLSPFSSISQSIRKIFNVSRITNVIARSTET